MNRIIYFAIGATAVVMTSAALAASRGDEVPLATPPGITVQAAPAGHMLGPQRNHTYADADGKSLYTYQKDAETPGRSACVGECAVLWPPMTAPAGAKAFGDWSIITRDDGTKQWAFRGKPLYRYAKDTEVGRPTGRGQEVGAWQSANFQPVPEMALPAGMEVGELPDALGQALKNAQGRTLYQFDGDVRRTQPRCADVPCRWIPVAAPALGVPIGDFTIITRPDQTMQWAYKGKALFSFDGDLEEGFAAGMGVDPKMSVVTLVRYFIPSNAKLVNSPGQGLVLANEKGMTLYRRDSWAFQQGGHGLRRGVTPRPVVGREIGTNLVGCDAECQKVWHPFKAPQGAQASGFWQIVVRDDGTRQWSYKGYALYTYDGDVKPGDIRGNDYYDFMISLDGAKQTQYPSRLVGMIGMGALAWLYAFP